MFRRGSFIKCRSYFSRISKKNPCPPESHIRLLAAIPVEEPNPNSNRDSSRIMQAFVYLSYRLPEWQLRQLSLCRSEQHKRGAAVLGNAKVRLDRNNTALK